MADKDNMKDTQGTRRVRADTVTLGGGDSTMDDGSDGRPEGSTTGITKCITEKMLSTGVQADKYVYVDEIGRGGMGSVLRVYDSNLRRHVAMKRILASTGERIRLRFVEEAQITGQLEHPHIVPVHEIGRDQNDRLYFTMKLVRGDTLSDILDKIRNDEKDAERYSLGHLLHAFINVCHAIDFAHSRGVIHRDIKPENIMLGQFGEVQVMDWGLAKARSSKTDTQGSENDNGKSKNRGKDEVTVEGESTIRKDVAPIESIRNENAATMTMDGQIIGTLAYMPPEQARGENDRIDERSDIYTLGVILYEILTLETPVNGTSNKEVIHKICHGSFSRPIERCPEKSIPAELDAITMKSLRRNRSQRYQTVKELRTDIELYLSGRSVSAKRDSFTEAVKKFLLRNKAVSSVVAVSCVAIIILGLFSGTQQRRANLAQTEVDRLEQERVDSTTRVWYEIHQEHFKSSRILEHWDVSIGWEMPSLAVSAENVGQYISADPDGMHVFSPDKQLTMLFREPVVGDVKMTYTATWMGGKDGGFHAIIHGNGWQEGYIFQLGGWGNTRSAILHADSDGLTELASSPFTLVPGQLYAVEAQKIGNVLSLFVNGEKIIEVAERLEDVLAGGPYRHCGFISGTDSESVYHHVAIYKYGSPKAVDLLDVADRFMLNAHYQTARDIYQEVFESLTSRERKERARTGLKKANDLFGLEGTRENYLDILAERWKDFDPKLWIERKALQLDLRGKDIRDIKILRGMELQRLNISGCKKVTSIDALRDMPLRWLDIAGTGIQDIRPLRGLDLQHLDAGGSQLKAYSCYVLRGMPLKFLDVSECSIRTISFMEGNSTIENLNIRNTGVTDIFQLTMPSLSFLNAAHNPITDISSLQGMSLVELDISETQVTTIEPLRDMIALRKLDISGLQITDLSPLRTLLLEELSLNNVPCDDLSQIQMLPVHTLSIVGTGITDLRPLQDMDVHALRFSPEDITAGIEVLRFMPNLETIAVNDSPDLSAEDFWQMWDAQHAVPNETILPKEE